jgi:hypothetical protein
MELAPKPRRQAYTAEIYPTKCWPDRSCNRANLLFNFKCKLAIRYQAYTSVGLAYDCKKTQSRNTIDLVPYNKGGKNAAYALFTPLLAKKENMPKEKERCFFQTFKHNIYICSMPAFVVSIHMLIDLPFLNAIILRFDS